MSTPLIKIEEASKRYLRNPFNIEVLSDDYLVISGGNGTGKTTLLLMILGFIYPDHGKVFKKRLKIGYVPEKVVLPPFVNVLEYLETMARIKKDRLNIALVHDLEVPIHKKIHELSKGNQQKLSIMTALMGNPHVLIFDEPLSGLDEQMQEKTIRIINSYYEKGKCIMVSTHEPNRFIPYATKHIQL